MNDVFWGAHRFQVCDYWDSWRDVGGVYIFTGLNLQLNLWVPQYIGKTGSFRNRIPSHGMWSPAVRLGATHVHAMVVEQEAMRAWVEQKLIAEYQPPLNDHYRSGSVWADLVTAALGLTGQSDRHW
jgi:hypothetical protein